MKNLQRPMFIPILATVCTMNAVSAQELAFSQSDVFAGAFVDKVFTLGTPARGRPHIVRHQTANAAQTTIEETEEVKVPGHHEHDHNKWKEVSPDSPYEINPD